MAGYDDTFFEHIDETSLTSAQTIVPIVMSLMDIGSVVDVGCGRGVWLTVFSSYGIEDFLGIDGRHVSLDTIHISLDRFMAADLSQSLTLDRKFDLVVSLEVAEHLPAESAHEFVETLTSLGDAVLFSAAIPGQGGTCHVNEQWQDYWAEIFCLHGFDPMDVIRPRIWEDSSVSWWYAQNIILYLKRGRRGFCLRNPRSFQTPQPVSLNRTHPKFETERGWNTRKLLVQGHIRELLEQGKKVAVTCHELIDGKLQNHSEISYFLQEDGESQGHPRTDEEALHALSELATRSIDVLVIPWTNSWYIEAYPLLWQELDTNFTRLECTEACTCFNLRS